MKKNLIIKYIMVRPRQQVVRRKKRSGWQKFVKGAGTAINVAGKALAIAQGVASLINVEKKYFDEVAVSTGISTTPAINCLTAVPSGTTDITRIGESIKALTFGFRLTIAWNASPDTERVRLLLVRDLDPNSNGVAPTMAQILQNTSTTQYLMQSYINMEYSHRFQILKDQVYSYDENKGTINVDYFYKFAKMTKQTNKLSRKADPHIRWTSGTATDYEFGHIWMILVSTTASDPANRISYVSRLRFIDN